MLGIEDWLRELTFGRLGAELLLPLGVVVSLAVTAHVLLNDRDAGSAMGWMGLAWLSPFIGGTLYALFGVNRVTRRGRGLRQDDSPAGAHAASAGPPAHNSHLAPLVHAAARLTGRKLLTGNVAEVLYCGDEAYPVMLRAITGARRSVALSELHPARRCRRWPLHRCADRRPSPRRGGAGADRRHRRRLFPFRRLQAPGAAPECRPGASCTRRCRGACRS